MKIPKTIIFLAALGVAFLSTSVSGISSERIHRSLFYKNTPFGSLAWMRGATTRSDARDRLTVDIFAPDECIVLPATGVQWFIINHREPELDGEPGYFSIRILYRTNRNEAGDQIRQGLHVHRNANWYDGTRKVVGSHERNPDQLAITERDFIVLHEPKPGEEAKSFETLQASLGSWHMAPSVYDETSWTDRYLFGAQLRAYSNASTSAVSARLIRFTATSRTSTGDPVVFWLDPLRATSALILVDAPRHPYQGSRRVYEVRFGGTCL